MTTLPPFLLEGFHFILAHESRELAAAGTPPHLPPSPLRASAPPRAPSLPGQDAAVCVQLWLSG